MSNDNKGSPQIQDVQIKNNCQPICTPFAPSTENAPANKVQMPTPRKFEGKDYYGTADVAKIIGVTRQNVSWWHNQGLFIADVRTHDGVYLYEIERVMQLKSVYHANWMRGGYQPSPTTSEQFTPINLSPPSDLANNETSSDDIQIDELKAELRSVNKALADFDSQKNSALEKLRNVEIFDSDTVFSEEIITATAFAKLFDKQTFSNFKRDIINYGNQHKEKKFLLMIGSPTLKIKLLNLALVKATC